MSILQPALAACVLCLCSASCQRAPLPASSGEPAGATPAANRASYRCADGSSLDVVYARGKANVAWADGRNLTLPRAESASKGGGDVYVGETVSLQHDGDKLQIHDGQAPALTCEQS